MERKLTAVLALCCLFIILTIWGWHTRTPAVVQAAAERAMTAVPQTPTGGDICTGDNLIANPSFEVGDYSPYIMDPPGHPDCQTWNPDEPNQYCERVKIADDWHPWWRSEPRTEVWMNIQPEYVPSLPHEQPPRVRTGDKSQHYFSFWSTHEAGLYQQVTAVPGATYCFSIWGHAWSARTTLPGWLSDPNDHGNLHQRVGIDPTGGTDWQSDTIIWGEARMQYDVFGQFSVEAAAEAETITVFLWSQADIPVKHNEAYWDDAVLTMADFTAVYPTSLNILADVDTPAVFTRTVFVDTTAAISWTVSLTGPTTLTPTLSPVTGSGSGQFDVTLDTSGYLTGTYSTTLHVAFSEPAANQSVDVPLTLWVVPEISQLYLPVILKP